MARRSEKRDAARSAYRRRMKRDGGVVLKDLAAELGVKYDTLLKWKKEDRWHRRIRQRREPVFTL